MSYHRVPKQQPVPKPQRYPDAVKRFDRSRLVSGLTIARMAASLGISAKDYREALRLGPTADVVLEMTTRFGGDPFEILTGLPSGMSVPTEFRRVPLNDGINAVRYALTLLLRFRLTEHQKWSAVHQLLLAGIPRGRAAGEKPWTPPDEEMISKIVSEIAQ